MEDLLPLESLVGRWLEHQAGDEYSVQCCEHGHGKTGAELGGITSQAVEHDHQPDQRADHAKGGSGGGHVLEDGHRAHGPLVHRLDSVGQEVPDRLWSVAIDDQTNTVLEEVVLTLRLELLLECSLTLRGDYPAPVDDLFALGDEDGLVGLSMGEDGEGASSAWRT